MNPFKDFVNNELDIDTNSVNRSQQSGGCGKQLAIVIAVVLVALLLSVATIWLVSPYIPAN
ncbi:hypothetical protein KAZ57_00285 [Patescibacteria group bacterium]|nr:hypothetical protein [Patescibacteria group bacterium]